MTFSLPFAPNPLPQTLLPTVSLTCAPAQTHPPLTTVQGCCTPTQLYFDFSVFQCAPSPGSTVAAVIRLPRRPIIAVQAGPQDAVFFQYTPACAVPFDGHCTFTGGENLTGIYWGCQVCLPLSPLGVDSPLASPLPLTLNCFLLEYNRPCASLFPFSAWDEAFCPSSEAVLNSLSPCSAC